MGGALSADPIPAGLPETMAEEFKLATAEGRQPRCIHCGQPLNRVEETQLDFLAWVWNEETKQYDKQPSSGDSDKPYCANCGTKDYDFLDNDFIDY